MFPWRKDYIIPEWPRFSRFISILNSSTEIALITVLNYLCLEDEWRGGQYWFSLRAQELSILSTKPAFLNVSYFEISTPMWAREFWGLNSTHLKVLRNTQLHYFSEKVFKLEVIRRGLKWIYSYMIDHFKNEIPNNFNSPLWSLYKFPFYPPYFKTSLWYCWETSFGDL